MIWLFDKYAAETSTGSWVFEKNIQGEIHVMPQETPVCVLCREDLIIFLHVRNIQGSTIFSNSGVN